MDEKILSQMIEAAFKMLDFSYVPYSHFHVGAALLGKNGKIYTGCNVENASFGPSNCAERTAFFKAVSEGCKDFDSIVITGGKENENGVPAVTDYCSPCGVCRQVMAEFCKKDFIIILAKSKDDYKVFTLGQLLPESFTL